MLIGAIAAAAVTLTATLPSPEVISVAPAADRDTEIREGCRGYGPATPDATLTLTEEIPAAQVKLVSQRAGTYLRIDGPRGPMCFTGEQPFLRWAKGTYQLSLIAPQSGPATPFHVVIRTPDSQRDPLARAAEIGGHDAVSDRQVLFHYPQLAPQDLGDDPDRVFALLGDAPAWMFVFLDDEPVLYLDGQAVLTTGGARLYIDPTKLTTAPGRRARFRRRPRRDDGFGCQPNRLATTRYRRLYERWTHARDVLNACKQDATPKAAGCERERQPGDPGCDPYLIPGTPIDERRCVLPYQRAHRRACRVEQRLRRQERARQMRVVHKRLRRAFAR